MPGYAQGSLWLENKKNQRKTRKTNPLAQKTKNISRKPKKTIPQPRKPKNLMFFLFSCPKPKNLRTKTKNKKTKFGGYGGMGADSPKSFFFFGLFFLKFLRFLGLGLPGQGLNPVPGLWPGYSLSSPRLPGPVSMPALDQKNTNIEHFSFSTLQAPQRSVQQL